MLTYELLRQEGVLIVIPEGPLTSADFEQMAAVVDPYIDEKGKLQGLMVYAESFPGWADFAALLSRLRFVRDHHRRIERVAAVSDSAVLSIFPRMAIHFVSARVQHFVFAERDAALRWVAGTSHGFGFPASGRAACAVKNLTVVAAHPRRVAMCRSCLESR